MFVPPGSEDLERTTAALDDAGQRLGKLFLTQLILNATFGVVIGSGLALIGVPSSPLWGLLAMILRFIHETIKKKEAGEGRAETDKIVHIEAHKLGKAVFCIPGLGRLDDCATLIVADALKREGYSARVSGADTEIEAGNAETVCVYFWRGSRKQELLLRSASFLGRQLQLTKSFVSSEMYETTSKTKRSTTLRPGRSQASLPR